MIYKTLQKIAIGTVFYGLSSTLYAIEACPTACNNLLDKQSCVQHYCYKENNSCVKCRWKVEVKAVSGKLLPGEVVRSRKEQPHCIPSVRACDKSPS